MSFFSISKNILFSHVSYRRINVAKGTGKRVILTSIVVVCRYIRR